VEKSNEELELEWVSEEKELSKVEKCTVKMTRSKLGGSMSIFISGKKPEPDNRNYPTTEEFSVGWNANCFFISGLGHPGAPEQPNYYGLPEYKTFIDILEKKAIEDHVEYAHLADQATTTCLYFSDSGVADKGSIGMTTLSVWKYGLPFYTKQLSYYPDFALEMNHGADCPWLRESVPMKPVYEDQQVVTTSSEDEQKPPIVGDTLYEKFCLYSKIMKKMGEQKVKDLINDFSEEKSERLVLSEALKRTNNQEITMAVLLNDESFTGPKNTKRINPKEETCTEIEKLYHVLKGWDCDTCTTSNRVISEIFAGKENLEKPNLYSVLSEFENKPGFVKYYKKDECNQQLTCT